MLKFFVVLALAFVCVNSERVAFTACPGGHPTPDWVEGASCNAERCVLTRGTTWRGLAQFQSR